MTAETVLIIDDSAELRATVEAVLLYGGYEPLSASTGQEGLDMVAERQPDVILIDLELPDTTGLKVVEQLNRQGLKIPTIMMTGYGSEGTAARALRLGVRDYLIKPFTTEEVLSSIERALEDSRLRSERDRLSVLLQDCARCVTLFGDIGRAIVLDYDLDLILRQIVEAGISSTGAEAGSLLLLDETMQELRVAADLGQAQGMAGNLAAQAGDERLYPVLQAGIAVRLHSREECNIEIQTGRATRAVLQVPLQAQGRILGLVTVDRWIGVEPFGERDEQMLKVFADYAVLALERAS